MTEALRGKVLSHYLVPWWILLLVCFRVCLGIESVCTLRSRTVSIYVNVCI